MRAGKPLSEIVALAALLSSQFPEHVILQVTHHAIEIHIIAVISELDILSGSI
jgi:hypothetical protein